MHLYLFLLMLVNVCTLYVVMAVYSTQSSPRVVSLCVMVVFGVSLPLLFVLMYDVLGVLWSLSLVFVASVMSAHSMACLVVVVTPCFVTVVTVYVT